MSPQNIEEEEIETTDIVDGDSGGSKHPICVAIGLSNPVKIRAAVSGLARSLKLNRILEETISAQVLVSSLLGIERLDWAPIIERSSALQRFARKWVPIHSLQWVI